MHYCARKVPVFQLTLAANHPCMLLEFRGEKYEVSMLHMLPENQYLHSVAVSEGSRHLHRSHTLLHSHLPPPVRISQRDGVPD